VAIQGHDTATLGTVSQSGIKILEGDSLVVSGSGVERFSNHFASGAKISVILESVDVELRSVDGAGLPIPGGELSILGAAVSSNGFQPTPYGLTISNGDTLNIVSHVVGYSIPDVQFPAVQISQGDSIVLGGPQGNEFYNDPQRSDAVVMVVFPLIDLEITTTDSSGLALAGIVSIAGATTGPSPENLSISSSGATVTVTGSYETENYTATDIQVVQGDSVVIKQSLGGLQVDTYQAGLPGAKINMVMKGDVAVELRTVDGNGDSLSTGQVQVDAGGFVNSPNNLVMANASTVNINGKDTATLGTVSQTGIQIFEGDSLVVSGTGVERFSNQVASGAKVTVVLTNILVDLRSIDGAGLPLPSGELSILGAAVSSNGFQPTPYFVTIANGDTLNITGHIVGTPIPDVPFPAVQIMQGDSIVLGGENGNEVHNDPQRAGAIIMVVFPVVDLVVTTTDEAGLSISGIVSISGGTTGPSPENTQISSDGSLVTVTGSFQTENYTVEDLQIDNGDSIVVKQTLGGLQVDKFTGVVAGAKINLVMKDDVPVEFTTYNEAGDSLATGQVSVNGGGFNSTPHSITFANGTTIGVDGKDSPSGATVSDSGIQIFTGDSLVVVNTGLERYPNTVASGAKVSVVLKQTVATFRAIRETGEEIVAGKIKLTGSASTNGFEPTSVIRTMGDGATVDLTGRLVLGSDTLEVATTALVVSEGDSIAVKASGAENPQNVVASGAKVDVVFDLVDVTVVTVDTNGVYEVNGRVDLSGGTSTNGFKPTPLSFTMFDGASVNVSGLHAITLAQFQILNVQIDEGDSLVVSDEGIQEYTHNGTGARLTIITPTNRAPIADAGADSTVECSGDPTGVTLNGTGSSDPDEDELVFTWTGSFPEGEGTVSGETPTVSLVHGEHTITLTVDDGKGGMDSDEVVITVEDSTPPEITIPAALVLEAQSPQGVSVTETAVVDFLAAATAEDLCEGVLTPDHNAPEDFFPLGESTVIWSAADTHENAGAGQQTVTVEDTTPPSIETVTEDLTIECTNPDGEEVALAVTASDLVDTELTYSWEIQVSPAVWEGIATTASMTDSFQLGEHTVRVIITDDFGNAAGDTISIVIEDTTPPELTLEGDAVINLELGTAFAEPGFIAVDLCSGDITAAVVVSGSVDENTEGTYNLSYSVEDGAELEAAASRTVNVVVTANSHMILASNSIYLKSQSQVHSGHVSVNAPGEKPFMNSKNELTIGSKAVTSSTSRLSGQDVRVKSEADVKGTLNYENLKADKKSHIANPVEVGAAFWPVVEVLPEFLNGTPGDEDVEVKSKKTDEIDAGAYGNVRVKSKGTLVFTGGVYELLSFDADSQSNVYFAAGTILLIKDSFDAGSKSFFGPAEGSAIDASDILVYVEGDEDFGRKPKKSKKDDDDENDEDDDNGNGGDASGNKSPKIVKIRSGATLQANVYAPSGTIDISSKAMITGSLISRDVSLGSRAQVALVSGWDMPGVIYVPESSGPAAKMIVIDEIPEVEEVVDAAEFSMGQNYPNPFNPTTMISYNLAEVSEVSLVVYNILGQQIRVLVNHTQATGTHSIQWDGRDAIGRQVSSGMYIYRLVAGKNIATRKMIFAK